MFPLPFVKDQRSLRTSVFWDVGNVFDTNCDSKDKCRWQVRRVQQHRPFRHGQLCGYRCHRITALGPLSFALAMPIKKPDDEAETQVSILLGQTF